MSETKMYIISGTVRVALFFGCALWYELFGPVGFIVGIFATLIIPNIIQEELEIREKKRPKLTKEEIENLNWHVGEKYALVNIETKSMKYTSRRKDFCKEILKDLNRKSNHPLYKKLILVEKPK